VERQTAIINAQLAELQSKGESLSITDMYTMQMLMNKLSQLSEMATNVMSAMHSAVMSPARAIKG
jgi:hypothetical protein